jgi:hypothetical protein
MAKPIYETVFNVTSEDDATQRILNVSKEHADLVFCWHAGFSKVHMFGFARTSDMPQTYYEQHVMRWQKFMRDGQPVNPTKAQLERVNRIAFCKD